MSDAIWVTGLGTLGAFGAGPQELARALQAARPLAREVDRSAGYHRRGAARTACLLPPGLLTPWISAAEARRMSPPSKMALAAARMALREAVLEGAAEGARTALAVATAFGPSSYTEGLLRQILCEGPEAASPSLFMESVANAPASQISIAIRARGASLTVCQREAGPLLAVAAGAAELRSGRASQVLTGTVEEMTPLLHAVLDRFGALAGGPMPDGSEGEMARPFDRCRDGFLAGEGSTVLVLEAASGAAARGAQPYARLLGWGSAFDPTAEAAGWGTGAASLARALLRTLERCGRAPQDVDLVVSGASGAVAGDRLEAQTLVAAWGGRPLPPLVTPKAITGEYGAGFLGAAILAAAGTPCGPTPGFRDMDPDLGVTPYDGAPLAAPRTVLVSTLAAGGAAAWLVLAAP
jgi:3-oxoacyl-[acyl-carrier-protein] synthase II